jgi:hypothetical protein
MCMEINRIEDSAASCGPQSVNSGRLHRSCLYNQEEVCRAPRCLYKMCQGCVRISKQAALSHLFERIKMMAHGFFKLEETELG